MKKGLYLLVIIFLTGCKGNDVSLNGANEMFIEVRTEFVDPGVDIPEGYTYTMQGTVNSDTLGRFELQYNVINEKGETTNTLTRIVNIVDTTPPTLVMFEDLQITRGVEQDVNELISVIDDNYYQDFELVITSNFDELILEPDGEKVLEITVTDPSGNSETFLSNVVLMTDVWEVAKYLEENNIIEGHLSSAGFYYFSMNDTSFFIYQNGIANILHSVNEKYNMVTFSFHIDFNYNTLHIDRVTLVLAEGGKTARYNNDNISNLSEITENDFRTGLNGTFQVNEQLLDSIVAEYLLAIEKVNIFFEELLVMGNVSSLE